MKYRKILAALIIIISAFVILSTLTGIRSDNGTGTYSYLSIRNHTVHIYGMGIYRHMSSEVAPQGIAQDYITLCIALPLLMFSFWKSGTGALWAQYVLAGTLAYLLVTYLFYTVMAMYNQLFLAYVILMGSSFYAFLLVLASFDTGNLQAAFDKDLTVKWTGSFLLFVSVSIAVLWLSIIVPPLIDGTIIPVQVEHYTTLIVQGLDLGILLPAASITGILWMKRSTQGYLLAPIYFVFLSLLMCALSAKVVAMFLLGYHVVPVIFIIPAFTAVSMVCTMYIFKHIHPYVHTGASTGSMNNT